jgi:pyruvate dehydrogenase E1 component alpha subunit
MDNARLLELYYRMVVVRKLEELLPKQHAQGKIKGPIHTCDGQEAVGIGVCSVLKKGDTITSTHRGHTHYIGMGIDLNILLAEIMGKANGLGKGQGGHMLIADREHGILGGNGIVGGGLPIATGQALAHKNLKTGGICVCFFGDGASNEGAFHECLNIASLWKLPVIYVCENNQYGLTTAIRRHMAHLNIADRALGYGIPGVEVDGNDILAVIEVAEQAADRARSGEGPTLVVAQTYRRKGFSTTDIGGYQPPEEVNDWPDPLLVTSNQLSAIGVKAEEIEKTNVKAEQSVEAAVKFGLESPYPDPIVITEWVNNFEVAK